MHFQQFQSLAKDEGPNKSLKCPRKPSKPGPVPYAQWYYITVTPPRRPCMAPVELLGPAPLAYSRDGKNTHKNNRTALYTHAES
eukprot:3020640-Amphidinium_carterae.2